MDKPMRDFLKKEGWARGDKLGSGGFGIVYSAWKNGRLEIAVKQMYLHSPSAKESLICEGLALENLGSHDNICVTQKIVTKGYCAFIVMPLYPNGDLDSYHRSKSLTREEVDKIIRGAIEGVQYMHSIGILHNDLKPQNVLIDRNGGSKLADFGMIVILSEGEVQKNGIKCGTDGYKSPEVCREEIVKRPSDIYSLGLIIFEILGKGHFLRYENPCDLLIEEMYTNAHHKLIDMPIRHQTMLLKMLNAKEFMRSTAEECLEELNRSQRDEAAQIAGAPERAESPPPALLTFDLPDEARHTLGQSTPRQKIISNNRIRNVTEIVVHTMVIDLNVYSGANNIRSAIEKAATELTTDYSLSRPYVDIRWFNRNDPNALHIRTTMSPRATMETLFDAIREAYIRLLNYETGIAIDVLTEEMEVVLRQRNTDQ